MVDQAFRATLRNFATLFLLIAVVTVPLHLVYSVIFANVIETRELHSVIETFPEARQVRGVGQSQLTRARVGSGIVALLELAAIPFLARGVRRVLRRAEDGGSPGVAEALGAIREEPGIVFSSLRFGPLLVAAAVGIALAFAMERSALLLLEFVPDERTYPFFGLIKGVSRALGAPFFLVTLVMAERSAPERKPVTPELY